MIRETSVQSQAESNQTLKKKGSWCHLVWHSELYSMDRVKWSNPEKGLSPFPTPRCSSYWKGSLQVTLDEGRQIYFLLIRNWKYVYKKNLLSWFCLVLLHISHCRLFNTNPVYTLTHTHTHIYIYIYIYIYVCVCVCVCVLKTFYW